MDSDRRQALFLILIALLKVAAADEDANRIDKQQFSEFVESEDNAYRFIKEDSLKKFTKCQYQELYKFTDEILKKYQSKITDGCQKTTELAFYLHQYKMFAMKDDNKYIESIIEGLKMLKIGQITEKIPEVPVLRTLERYVFQELVERFDDNSPSVKLLSPPTEDVAKLKSLADNSFQRLISLINSNEDLFEYNNQSRQLKNHLTESLNQAKADLIGG